IADGTLAASSVPSITGTAKVGHTLTAQSGSWTPAPDSTSYQWLRCDNSGASCSSLSGATGSTYALVAADLGSTIRLDQTATKTSYANDTQSSATTAVVVSGTFSSSAAPSISGTLAVGQTLTANTGTWTPAPNTTSYQWLRCDSTANNCNPILGQNAGTYTLALADLGNTIRLNQTATSAGYSDDTQSSNVSATIAAGDFSTTTAVAVNGTPAVGTATTLSAATYSTAATAATYQSHLSDTTE